jgi:hypothetical protein
MAAPEATPELTTGLRPGAIRAILETEGKIRHINLEKVGREMQSPAV